MPSPASTSTSRGRSTVMGIGRRNTTGVLQIRDANSTRCRYKEIASNAQLPPVVVHRAKTATQSSGNSRKPVRSSPLAGPAISESVAFSDSCNDIESLYVPPNPAVTRSYSRSPASSLPTTPAPSNSRPDRDFFSCRSRRPLSAQINIWSKPKSVVCGFDHNANGLSLSRPHSLESLRFNVRQDLESGSALKASSSSPCSPFLHSDSMKTMAKKLICHTCSPGPTAFSDIEAMTKTMTDRRGSPFTGSATKCDARTDGLAPTAASNTEAVTEELANCETGHVLQYSVSGAASKHGSALLSPSIGKMEEADMALEYDDNACKSSPRSNVSAEERKVFLPKSILKHPASNALITDDNFNSWYTQTPYATTPKFTRLGLAAPGVVLPISAKERKRQSTMAVKDEAGQRDKEKREKGFGRVLLQKGSSMASMTSSSSSYSASVGRRTSVLSYASTATTNSVDNASNRLGNNNRASQLLNIPPPCYSPRRRNRSKSILSVVSDDPDLTPNLTRSSSAASSTSTFSTSLLTPAPSYSPSSKILNYDKQKSRDSLSSRTCKSVRKSEEAAEPVLNENAVATIVKSSSMPISSSPGKFLSSINSSRRRSESVIKRVKSSWGRSGAEKRLEDKKSDSESGLHLGKSSLSEPAIHMRRDSTIRVRNSMRMLWKYFSRGGEIKAHRSATA